jgi:methylisocitrate lyase
MLVRETSAGAALSQSEMVDRVKAAVAARTDPDFVIMARTDALAVEGLESAIARAVSDDGVCHVPAFRRRGEGTGARQHHRVRQHPVIHGRRAAVGLAIRRDGAQRGVLDTMQTRDELYERIDYYAYEQRLDALFAEHRE